MRCLSNSKKLSCQIKRRIKRHRSQTECERQYLFFSFFSFFFSCTGTVQSPTLQYPLVTVRTEGTTKRQWLNHSKQAKKQKGVFTINKSELHPDSSKEKWAIESFSSRLTLTCHYPLPRPEARILDNESNIFNM